MCLLCLVEVENHEPNQNADPAGNDSVNKSFAGGNRGSRARSWRFAQLGCALAQALGPLW